MSPFVSRVFLAAAALALFAGIGTAAGVPDPVNSTTDGDLMLGNARGLPVLPLALVRPTLANGYQVVVNDVGGNPLPGVTVTISLGGTGLQAHSTQSGGQTAPNCATLNVIMAVTNAAGAVTFNPATVGINSSPIPNVQIRANGILLTTVRFRSVDLSPAVGNPLGVVGLADLNEFRRRFLSLAPYSNLDPACDFASEGLSAGIVDLADLNVFRTEYLCGAPGAPIPAPCTQTLCP